MACIKEHAGLGPLFQLAAKFKHGLFHAALIEVCTFDDLEACVLESLFHDSSVIRRIGKVGHIVVVAVANDQRHAPGRKCRTNQNC